eukprot:612539-Amphidinium_carterae.3
MGERTWKFAPLMHQVAFDPEHSEPFSLLVGSLVAARHRIVKIIRPLQLLKRVGQSLQGTKTQKILSSGLANDAANLFGTKVGSVFQSNKLLITL